MLSSDIQAQCEPRDTGGPECVELESITIFGTVDTARDVAGGASLVTRQDLEKFEITDVTQALRQVPGVSTQLEDGYGLRPNISIRGTATERSSRITLMEDGVLIAPAPYSAPSAYYFPTFGRISEVEVLKGPASITQGPYTVGGAINLQSTPIPSENSGYLQGEYGSNDTWRLQGWYGGGNDRAGFLVETHQWQSDGFQKIDRNKSSTGLDKRDYLAKFAIYSDPATALFQSLEIKIQSSEEDSQQSYLGLTDTDFDHNPKRRYGLSSEDEMHNEHEQFVLNWRIETPEGFGMTTMAYRNNFERAWYKTEGVDFDGSSNPESFKRTSWSSVVAAVNTDEPLGGLEASELQAILDGADTAQGSIQLRNNAREYYAQGIQLTADKDIRFGAIDHALQAGLRYHEDEEDRLQRNDNFQQLGGILVLNSTGLEGNAGNRIQDAKAWAAYIFDRIEFDRWTLTPGLRYESIKLSRVRYKTNSDDPSSRDPDNFRDTRKNEVNVWLPGIGAIFDLNDNTRLVGGVHRGFATPGNEPGVDPEESTNFELGVRHQKDRLSLEAMFFFNDYENLVGVCTNSSGSDCDPGDSFNGEGVHIPGIELTAQTSFELGNKWTLPIQLSFTWMDAKFQSNFDSEFFGHVSEGDPVPYVPEFQYWASIGLEGGPWSFYLSASHVDSVCTRASCGEYEQTEDSTVLNLSGHFQINKQWQLYAVVENLTDDIYLVAREPYGARPNKPRSVMTGARFNF